MTKLSEKKIPEATTDRGTFETPHASRYLRQFCKHFAHKVEVRFDERTGEVAFPTGPARLTADAERLVAEIEAADPAGLELARGIIDRHLERFAFREGFTRMTWQLEIAGERARGG